MLSIALVRVNVTACNLVVRLPLLTSYITIRDVLAITTFTPDATTTTMTATTACWLSLRLHCLWVDHCSDVALVQNNGLIVYRRIDHVYYTA